MLTKFLMVMAWWEARSHPYLTVECWLQLLALVTTQLWPVCVYCLQAGNLLLQFVCGSLEFEEDLDVTDKRITWATLKIFDGMLSFFTDVKVPKVVTFFCALVWYSVFVELHEPPCLFCRLFWVCTPDKVSELVQWLRGGGGGGGGVGGGGGGVFRLFIWAKKIITACNVRKSTIFCLVKLLDRLLWFLVCRWSKRKRDNCCLFFSVAVREEGLRKLWQGVPPALYRHVSK